MKQIVLEQTKFVKMLVYGESGTGKTTLVGSFHEDPRSSPLLVLNCGGQPISLRFLDPPPLVLEIEDTKDLNAPYNWLAEGQAWETIEMWAARSDPFAAAVIDYFAGKPGVFKTVAIDSITHLQQTSFNRIVGGTRLPGDVPKQAQIQHWGQIRAQTTNIADVFYHLPNMHVVITALTAHTFIEAYGRTEYGPMLSTKSSFEVPSMAQIVARVMNIDSLAARDLRAAKQKAPDAFNVLLTQGGMDFAAKFQGVRSPPAALFNARASDLLDIVDRG